MCYLKTFLLFFSKDLLLELRRKEIISAVLYFSILVTVMSSFALAADNNLARHYFPALYCLTIIFSVTLYLSRTFDSEREGNLLDQLCLIDYPKTALFLSKFVAQFAYLAVILILQLAIFYILLNLTFSFSLIIIYLIALSLLFGLLASGLLFATMMQNDNFRELLLPLLLFPINLPLLFASLRLIEAALAGYALNLSWLSILLAFDIILLVLSLTFFEIVLRGNRE